MPLSATFQKIILRFSGFSLIGAANTLLSMLIIYILNERLQVNYVVSYCTAYILTVLLAYIANALLIFRTKIAILSCLGFFGAYLSGMVFGSILLYGIKKNFPVWNATLISFGVIGITMIWNFFFVNKILSVREDSDGK